MDQSINNQVSISLDFPEVCDAGQSTAAPFPRNHFVRRILDDKQVALKRFSDGAVYACVPVKKPYRTIDDRIGFYVSPGTMVRVSNLKRAA